MSISEINEAMFNRLPKWAQDYMRSQEREIKSQTERIARLSNSFLTSEGEGLKKTLVKMDGQDLCDPDVPLPDDAEIEFTITRHNRVDVTIRESEFTPGKRVLKVMSNGCDPMLIKMHASNSFEVVFDEDRRL